MAGAVWIGIAPSPVEATMPMRHRTLQGCVLDAFIVTREVLLPEAEGFPGVYGVHEIADYESPPDLDIDWNRYDGKLVTIAYRSGQSGRPPRARRVLALTREPTIVADCPADIVRQLPRVLYDRADSHARNINPFADAGKPLTGPERGSAEYALRLIEKALALEPQSCRLHVLRAFVLDRARKPNEALSALTRTRTSLRCDPIHERVAKHGFPDAKLPVEAATDAEAEAHERAMNRPR